MTIPPNDVGSFFWDNLFHLAGKVCPDDSIVTRSKYLLRRKLLFIGRAKDPSTGHVLIN